MNNLRSACIVWTGRINPNGYGVTAPKYGTTLAHRIAYIQANGTIPADLTIDHLCRVTTCVNPDHFEAVTRAENTRRGNSARGLRTHCRRGHEFTPENTKIGSDGYRTCRTCFRARDREAHARVRALAKLAQAAGLNSDEAGAA